MSSVIDSDPSTKGVTDTGVEPTKHAELRFLERVNPREPYPAARIREIVANGDRTDLLAFEHPAYLQGDVAVLVDEAAGQAVTVLEPAAWQFSDRGGRR